MAQVKTDKKLKICYIPYYGYEVDNLAFADKYKRRWTNILKDKLEKDGHSFATYDINTIEDSDYIISFDNTYFQNVRHFWNIWRAGKLGRTLHIDYEPPSAMVRIHSDRGLKILSKIFTIMTYNDNVVNGKSILKGVVGDYHEKERAYKRDFERRKLLCMVANNRARIMPIEPWPSELYTAREDAACYFSEKHAKDFDLYGDYWPNNWNPLGIVKRNQKLDVLSKYKFVISYDSITNQNGYISEKIFDVFAAKSVPIYWGANNVTDYIPKECFIDRRDFSSDENLFKYINIMTKNEYEHRIAAIEEYLKSDQYKSIFSSDAIADNIINNFIYRKPRHINRLTSAIILMWFTYIYRTNKHYNFDNYFFDIKNKKLKDIVYGIDKATKKGKHVFVIYVNITDEQSIYIAYGENEPVRPIMTHVSDNGIYETVSFEIPYDDIVKSKKVFIFTQEKNCLTPLKISHAKSVNKTFYDDGTKFRVIGNKIQYVRRTNYYIQKIVSILRRIKNRIIKPHKPEIIYYPHVAEPPIMNDEPFNLTEGNYSWEQQLKIIADQYGIEVHTQDKAKFKNVMGVIFFDNMFYHNLTALNQLHEMGLLEKTVYIDYEPPTGHAKKHEPESIKALSSLFKAVVTYDDDLANKGNFVKCNVANFYAKPSIKREFTEKKFAAMVTNNTSPNRIIEILNLWNNTDYYSINNTKPHKKAIYRKRLEIAEYFYQNHPDKLHLFGTGYPDRLKDFTKGFLPRSEKIDVMSGYKFAIAFDSYTNQNGYISEKIFDAFFAKTVPVYLGADNVSEYIPKKCFVDMRDFASYEALYKYLNKMSRKEYESRIDAIEVFLKSDKFKEVFSSRAIAQTLFNTITSSATVSYNRSRARNTLDGLDSERNKLSTESFMTPRIDRELINKRWCFVISVRAPKTWGRQINMHAVANGKKIKFETHNDKHSHLVGNLCMVIPYEDVYNMKRIEFFVSSRNGKSAKLDFSSTVLKTINETHYDDQNAFFVDKNVIGCRKVSTLI